MHPGVMYMIGGILFGYTCHSALVVAINKLVKEVWQLVWVKLPRQACD